MELLEYLVRLQGAATAEAEIKGVRDKFVEMGAAAKEAAGAASESDAAAAGAGSSHKGAAGSAGGFGAAMGKMAKVGAVGLVALGLTAVKMSNTFQTEMLKIRTEGGASQKEFTKMRAAVLNLAASGQSFGQGPTSLAQGLYHLESMGIRGNKAILGLKLASEEAAISGASLEDTTTSLGGALFIAAKGTNGLKGVMGALNAIAGSGNMRFQELNDALGTGLLGSAKTAGVSLQEMGAALAVLTDSGHKASSAGAQLGTALHYLYSPTQKAEGALASIGLTGSKLAADLRKPQGILVALQDLKKHMANLSPSAQANVLNSILPGSRGRVLLNLYQLQGRLAPKYQQIIGTQNDFGAHQMQQAMNPTTKLRIGVAKLEAGMIKLGDAVTKYVTPAAAWLLGVLAGLLGVILSVFNWFVKMSPAAKALGTFIGILAATFLAWRAATILQTIAMGLLNAVMDANPIGLVVLAIAALAAGFVYAYNKSKTFRDIVNAVWGWLKGAVVDTVHFFSKHWGMLGDIISAPFVGLASFIGKAFPAVKNAVVDVLNWIIGKVNVVIGVIDKLHIHTPFGNIGAPHIAKIGLIATGGGQSGAGLAKQKVTHSLPGHQAQAAAKTTSAFTAPASHSTPGHQGALIVHGDIVVRARENELGRVTRRQIQNAMAS